MFSVKSKYNFESNFFPLELIVSTRLVLVGIAVPHLRVHLLAKHPRAHKGQQRERVEVEHDDDHPGEGGHHQEVDDRLDDGEDEVDVEKVIIVTSIADQRHHIDDDAEDGVGGDYADRGVLR